MKVPSKVSDSMASVSEEDSSYNFISGSLLVCVCKEELKSNPSVCMKSGRKYHIQYENGPFLSQNINILLYLD